MYAIESEAGTEQADHSVSTSRVVPMGISACALMIAVDYLFSGNWSGAPYYFLAGLTLALTAFLGRKARSRKTISGSKTGEDMLNTAANVHSQERT
ncbi:hypothetical protein BTA51_19850 [Hahella sp. CCB-MM4]|uniref:hypothetical protein n=1 Tax=Hahella sp. (strain CCB-MM4) TaxID=1926491 RepID=UPI000B9C5E0A|nr:hypothetical protein [Hahella sp. CCB-MM4]OZG71541.1 hypothetical protein BTA51_19850 [Hahella sp. CCB-MM4]